MELDHDQHPHHSTALQLRRRPRRRKNLSSLQFGQELDFLGIGEGSDTTRVTRRGEELVLIQSRSGYCVAATCMNAASDTLIGLRQAISDGMRLDYIDKEMTAGFASHQT
jgi:hypothetical protein